MKQNELELLRELAIKVAEMRASQKLFFQYKSHSALNDSKRLEKEVDLLIKKVGKTKGEIEISAKGVPYIQKNLLQV